MHLRSIICLLACFGLVRMPAQDPAPEELVQLRRQFEMQGLSKARLLSEQFANALANIVREAGAEGDYEQALAAQRRRAQIIGLYSNSLDDTVLANVILLKPGDARVNGAVNFDRNLNALVSWKTAGSIATWEVSRVIPGTYEVTLTYATAEIGDPGRVNPFAVPPDLSTGGDFEFYEDSSLPGAEQNRRTGTVASTGGWTEWQTLTLPPIQITRTSARLSLRISKARGTGGVMNLKGIRLAPPSATTAAPSGSPDTTSPPKDELTVLREMYADGVRRATTPVLKAYEEKMTAMSAKSAGSDASAAAEFTAEASRAARLLEDPLAALSGGGKGLRPDSDGFRELRDVVYVENPGNTGDRLKIKQGGEEFFVRLLWVSCPPADAKEEKRLKNWADYFRISVEDAREVGREAREFTARYLSGKSLTLLTRGTKDEEGNLLVVVRPGKFGDFSGVLVDNGLAMIKPVTGKKGPARDHDEAVLRNLKEREATAKSRSIPPGAWARSVAP